MVKTNAMRLLDKAKIKYDTIEYEIDENDLSGVTIAKKANLDDKMVSKTLVAKEVDLKKAAKISGNKKIEMVHVKDLLGLTGYIRGGCSPVGMKKKFDTYFDETCKNFEKITVSAGVRGCQLLLNTGDITKFTNAKINSLTMEECE